MRVMYRIFSSALLFVILLLACQVSSAQETHAIRRDTVILLDVSTSMIGQVAASKIEEIENPPHVRYPNLAGFYYVQSRDVLSRAIDVTLDEINKFMYGQITLILFQGETFASTRTLPVIRLDVSIDGRDDVAKERLRRLLEGGADTDEIPLWNEEWEGIEAAIRAMGKGTGSEIYRELLASLSILETRLEEEQSGALTGVLPWGYSQELILITDGEETKNPLGFAEIAQRMQQLHQRLGPKFFMKRLFWGVECPNDELARALDSDYYTCIPLQGSTAQVLLSDIALIPTYNPINEASLDFQSFYLYVRTETTDPLIPIGILRIAVGEFSLEIDYSIQQGDLPRQQRKTSAKLQESGVRVNIASLVGNQEALPELEMLRGSVPLGKHSFPFRLVVDHDRLQSLYSSTVEALKESYRESNLAVEHAQVVGEFRLEHTMLDDDMSALFPYVIALQRESIPVSFEFQSPEILITAVPSPNSANTVVFTIRPNEAARRIASGLDEGVAIALQLSGAETGEWTGHAGNIVRIDGSLGEVTVQHDFTDSSAGSTVQFFARSECAEVELAGNTSTQFKIVDFSASRQARYLDIWPCRIEPDGSLLQDTSALTVFCDVRFSAEFAGYLHTELHVHANLPEGIDVQLVTTAPISCPIENGRSQRFAFSIRAENDAALRALNQSENEITLRFSPQLEDSFSYPSVSVAQIPIDLMYLEQYIELRFEPSNEETLRPGTMVGELTAYCAGTTAEGDTRTISVRYDPATIEIKNAQKTTGDVCLLTASPRDDGRIYAVVVSSNIWEEYPNGGSIETTLRDESAMLPGTIYSGLPEATRNIGFVIPAVPLPPPVLSLVFFWLGAACAGILVLSALLLVVYAYAIDQGGLKQVLLDIQDVNVWMIYASGGVAGLMILSLVVSLVAA
jgi:hypothetical protein